MHYKVTIYNITQQAIRTEAIEADTMKTAIQLAADITDDTPDGVSYRVDKVGYERGAIRPITKMGARAGVRTQSKCFTFRLDDEIETAFAGVQNKGRLINNLLRSVLQADNPTLDDKSPTLDDIYDRRP